MMLVNIITLTLWHLTTSVMFDIQCAAENMKGWLKAALRTCQLEDIFIEPCGIYAILQLVCFVNRSEKGGFLIKIFENSSGIKGLMWFVQNLLLRTYSQNQIFFHCANYFGMLAGQQRNYDSISDRDPPPNPNWLWALPSFMFLHYISAEGCLLFMFVCFVCALCLLVLQCHYPMRPHYDLLCMVHLAVLFQWCVDCLQDVLSVDMLLKLTRNSHVESQSNCAPVIQHVKSKLYAFFVQNFN